MAIPDYQACVLPLLKEARGRQGTKFSTLVGELGSDFALTEEEMSQLLPSGSQHILAASPVIINCIIAIRRVFQTGNPTSGKQTAVAYHATVFKVMIGSVGDVL